MTQVSFITTSLKTNSFSQSFFFFPPYQTFSPDYIKQNGLSRVQYVLMTFWVQAGHFSETGFPGNTDGAHSQKGHGLQRRTNSQGKKCFLYQSSGKRSQEINSSLQNWILLLWWQSKNCYYTACNERGLPQTQRTEEYIPFPTAMPSSLQKSWCQLSSRNVFICSVFSKCKTPSENWPLISDSGSWLVLLSVQLRVSLLLRMSSASHR